MKTFDIQKAIDHYKGFKEKRSTREQSTKSKRETLQNDIKKELEACREIKAKYEYISEYLGKDDSRSGLFRDLPDERLSYRTQSILRQFLLRKLIEEDRGVDYGDITPAKPKETIVQQKLKELQTCDKKLMAVGDGYILKFANDLKEYVSGQDTSLEKMTIKQYTNLYEFLWAKHEDKLVDKHKEEFGLIQEKAILLQDLEALSEADRKTYIRELYIKNGVSNVRKSLKTFAKLAD